MRDTTSAFEFLVSFITLDISLATSMSEYSPLPTNNNKQNDDVDSSSAKKSIGALLVLSLCAGSVAVYNVNNQVANKSTMDMSYQSACLQGASGNAVLAGYDLVMNINFWCSTFVIIHVIFFTLLFSSYLGHLTKIN
jgi:hypothetical protein